jgi:DNA polymerase
MDYLEQKINQLKWLRGIGIDCYYSNTDNTEKNTNKVNFISQDKNNKAKEMNTVTKEVQEIKSAQPPNKQKLDQNANIELARQLADISDNLDILKKNVLNFEGCDLRKLSSNTVFSDGNPKAEIMLIGEAPGASEDATGIPFCGESGKLLDKMLSCVGISRKDNAYITNTVFWRPPGNRPPTQEEIDICRPFVEKHIYLINPKLIVLVGSTAATSLLGKHSGINKIRQEYYLYSNKYLNKPIPITAIFHPAYLLRQPLQKKTTWYDLLKIQQFIKEYLK